MNRSTRSGIYPPINNDRFDWSDEQASQTGEKGFQRKFLVKHKVTECVMKQ